MWAATFLLYPDGMLATAPGLISHLIPNHILLSLWLIFVASLSLLGVLIAPLTICAWLLFIPQQLTLFLSASSAIIAIYLSQYGDGVLRPHSFILTDQLPIILAAICHSVAIISDLLVLHYKKF
jgi:hypothetical protein